METDEEKKEKAKEEKGEAVRKISEVINKCVANQQIHKEPGKRKA